MGDTDKLIERLIDHGRSWKVGDDSSEQRARDCDKAAAALAAQQKRIAELEAALIEIRDVNPSCTTLMADGTWRDAFRDLQRIARAALQASTTEENKS